MFMFMCESAWGETRQAVKLVCELSVHGEVAVFQIRFDLAEHRESGSISPGVQ